MTSVYLEKDGDKYIVQAEGHATGSRDVCTSVSSLLFTLSGYLHNSEEVIETEEKLESGDSYIEFEGGKEAETIFNVMMIGFLQIEATCPDYIIVKVNTK